MIRFFSAHFCRFTHSVIYLLAFTAGIICHICMVYSISFPALAPPHIQRLHIRYHSYLTLSLQLLEYLHCTFIFVFWRFHVAACEFQQPLFLNKKDFPCINCHIFQFLLRQIFSCLSAAPVSYHLGESNISS